jgi:hypothetical protein
VVGLVMAHLRRFDVGRPTARLVRGPAGRAIARPPPSLASGYARGSPGD